MADWEITGGSTHPPLVASSGQEWQYEISTVRAHIHGYISPFILLDLYMLELILADQLAEIDIAIYTVRFILLEVILADLPPIQAFSGSEWQYEIYTVRVHIGRSTPLENASSGPEWQHEIPTVRAHIGR